MDGIRNFCIIAHIDHGKSTLADRMMEQTKSVDERDKGTQRLDQMELEQEKGITIKLTPIRMERKGNVLNLIDTPGHVDFQYEVSRSIACVDGAVLLVDASQGVQAQTLSNYYMAEEYGLDIIPVLNKIDLPAAQPEKVAGELEAITGISKDKMINISAKTGENVETVLDAVVDRLLVTREFKKFNLDRYYHKQTLAKYNNYSRGLIFDCVYDQYKGVVAYVRVLDGEFKVGKETYLIHSDKKIKPTELGYFRPAYDKQNKLKEGEIGYIVTGQKSVRDIKIGDTILALNEDTKMKDKAIIMPDSKDPIDVKKFAVPGFKEIKPFVYSGVYPVDRNDYDKLKKSFEKLILNDSSITYEYESSKALGQGMRCGFLGNLHMNIIKERLEREYDVDTLFTSPNVIYLVETKRLKTQKMESGINVVELIKSDLYKDVFEILGKDIDTSNDDEIGDSILAEKYRDILQDWLVVRSGTDMPDMGNVERIYEPYVNVEIVGEDDYSGNIMELAKDYRGEMQNMKYIDESRIRREYHMPLGEIIVDFYDKLKSVSKGYGSMNYTFIEYRKSDLVRLDLLVNEEPFDSFSQVVFRDNAYYKGKKLVKKLKKHIPKHQFPVPLQAGIGSSIIARETIPALKKDVLSKCYGGDVSRKRKLLEKQKEGKQKMKQMGSVSIPSDIFIKVARDDD